MDLTSFIVKVVVDNLKYSNALEQNTNYENVCVCFISMFEHTSWYFLKKHFGIPFQEFGYKCCDYYAYVCCDDKLNRITGYRLYPYIISVLLF